MNSSKPGVRLIADVCKAKGIRYAVFSPGSRSAPLVIAFSQIPEIECIVIPDERVAGYFALGLAQQTGKPVAVICTSGTAVLNLGPALCEAYYQHIPMLFLTADRPKGAEENGENQAINQAGIFGEITVGSYDFDFNGSFTNGQNEADSLGLYIHEITEHVPGPLHINVRLDEPLYDFEDVPHVNYNLPPLAGLNEKPASKKALDKLNAEVLHSAKKLLVVGMKNTSEEFAKKIKLLAQREDVVVLAESLSNLHGAQNVIFNYDACIDLIEKGKPFDFIPEVVITLGSQIISKKLRHLLKRNKPAYHWDISPFNENRQHEIFDILVNGEQISENEILDTIIASEIVPSSFAFKWSDINKTAIQLTQEYLSNIAFSDFKVHQLLANGIPENAHVQYGNSTPIRYSNFFRHKSSLKINSNRGTSGIDGSVSTAAGAAYATDQLTTCIVGDISFFYDSNALWNNYLSPNLRIVLINNSGGNIFRLLKGPTTVTDFEKFFETRHNLTAKHLAEMYEIPYYFCDHQERLEKILPVFFQPHNGKPAILEIKTDGELSADIYKGYFEFLKNN